MLEKREAVIDKVYALKMEFETNNLRSPTHLLIGGNVLVQWENENFPLLSHKKQKTLVQAMGLHVLSVDNDRDILKVIRIED